MNLYQGSYQRGCFSDEQLQLSKYIGFGAGEIRNNSRLDYVHLAYTLNRRQEHRTKPSE